MPQIRVVEVLAALSLTTDLASGVPFEKGLRTCAVATAFGRELGLPDAELAVVFHAALLRAVGCTAHASENAEQFGDDIAFQAALKELDLGDPEMFAAQLARFGDWAGPSAQPRLAQDFLATAAITGPRATRASCEVGRAIGPQLGLPDAVLDAVDQGYERWDGRGLPGAVAGEAICLAARITHLAEQAVLAHAAGSAQRGGGDGAAVAEVRRRAGGHLDPDLAARFVAAPDAGLAPLAAPDILAAVIAAEPGTVTLIGPDGFPRLCRALAMIVDLKGRYLLGHSDHVATLVARAARLAGLGEPAARELETAALLHDIGRVGVPSSIWDRPGPLGPAQWERVRLHTYWTGRVLERCPALAPLADLAASHHEHLDGSGYHRGIRGTELGFDARLLAAADAFAELTEPRPDRPPLAVAEAASALSAQGRAGLLDAETCAAVIEAAGEKRLRAPYPCELTEREVGVLRLTARGLSNPQIAAELVLSTRTVGNHLARVYDKIGRRTRAGAAVFAMEHGLLRAPGSPD